MKTIEQAQKEINDFIIKKTWGTIRTLVHEDDIYDVQMQGSYAKGTDLPNSGSDMDLFIIFKTNVSQRIREIVGVEIGMAVLKVWKPKVKDATSKYVEAFFEYEGYEFEVQIVPIRHLTLDQIQSKQVDDKPISIGMERTPYQTAFMIEHLKGQTEEVRKLKQFMKDNGIYDSSMKSQGFSGYATECLIYYLGSFEMVMHFFANLKKGIILGDGKPSKDNIFSIIDPIDGDRDLVSAFSDEKIVKTVRIAQYYVANGKPPVSSAPLNMDSVIVNFNVPSYDEDIIVGQVRKTMKSIVKQVKKFGFEIPSIYYPVNNFTVEIPRTSMSIDGSSISMAFGVTYFDIPHTYEDVGVPIGMEKAVNQYMEANDGCAFVSKDGRFKAIKKRKFTNVQNAIKYIIEEGDVKVTNITENIRQGCIVREKSKFENSI